MIDGKIIKKIRKEKGLSQKQLASGITTQGTISAIERGAITPNSNLLSKIAQRLDMSMENFISDDVDFEMERQLIKADSILMRRDYQEVLNMLNEIDEETINDIEKKAHYIFLKTTASMWINKDYDDAIFGYNRVQQLIADRHNIYVVLSTSELGVVYSMKKDMDKSNYYFEQLPAIIDEISWEDHVFAMMLIISNLQKYYICRHKYTEENQIFKKAIEFANSQSITYFVEALYLGHACLLFEKDDKWSKEAVLSLVKAYSFADFTNNKTDMKEIKKLLSKVDITIEW